MSWIKTILYDQAGPALKKLYQRVAGPEENIDNVLLVHSLRPHTLVGHMTLYKNVLHHANNTLPKWYLEAMGVYVSFLNHCDYCVQHHYAGFLRLYDDKDHATNLMPAIKGNALESFVSDRWLYGFHYAKKLTLQAPDISHPDFTELKGAGFDDGEILEINQVVSYFNYVNRTVNGLGVTTDGDILGLSPNQNDDPNNWHHD